MTYERAREEGIEDWTLRAKGEGTNRSCGFCLRYNREQRKGFCRRCPLVWCDPEIEPTSRYCENSLSCSRNFWHWYYWQDEAGENSRWAKHWARKMLAQIKATPEKEEGR